MSDGSLFLGDLDLRDESSPFKVLGDGFNLGAGESITEALPRLLLDGEVVSGDRTSNRELSFTVEVSGADAIELAENEAALIAEANKPRNTLTWTPPNFAVPTVFDTFRATVRHLFDDLDELRRKVRKYEVTIPALPFGRSESKATTSAILEGAATVVDACDLTTGWTVDDGYGYSYTPTIDSTVYATSTASIRAYVGVARAPLAWDSTMDGLAAGVWFRRAASFSMGGARFLTIQVRHQFGNGNPVQLLTGIRNGSAMSLEPVVVQAMGAGWYRNTFDVGDGTISQLAIFLTGTATVPTGTGPSTAGIWVDDLTKLTEAGSTTKHATRLLDVQGSVRTTGSLQVSHATSALGDTVIYTCEDRGDGYRPDLRRWRKSGPTVVADATAMSGVYDPLTFGSWSSATTFDVPAASLSPGAYAILARVKRSGGSSASAIARATTILNGQTVGTTDTTPTYPVAGGGWSIAPLGVFHLPTAALPPGSTAVVRIQIIGENANTYLDEAWLFRMDGALTEVACGTAAPSAGGSSNRLWVDSPSLEQPQGGVWVGYAADRSDARAAGPLMTSLGRHAFVPPKMSVYVGTSNATGATVTLQHYPRWHTNAAS